MHCGFRRTIYPRKFVNPAGDKRSMPAFAGLPGLKEAARQISTRKIVKTFGDERG